jgi:hypothetical protein
MGSGNAATPGGDMMGVSGHCCQLNRPRCKRRLCRAHDIGPTVWHIIGRLLIIQGLIQSIHAGS